MILDILIGFLFSFGKAENELRRENMLLRYQIAILKRRRRKIVFRVWDRPLLVWFSKWVPNWRSWLVVVEPETIIRWHRKAFGFYWGWKFSWKNSGRRALPKSLIELIQDISRKNPLWGAPRIHGEIAKLGIRVSQASVEKYMIRRKRPRGPTWKSFIKNNMKETVAIDFFVVPTIRFRMLWALVVLSHDRRRIIHTAVTHQPSPAWTMQQLRNAFAFSEMPKYIVRDRDRNFWDLSRLGVKEVITGFRCPWQNAYVERVIGTIRRECTDHIIVFSERHLSKLLAAYTAYYNTSRTHLSLNKDSPLPRVTRKIGKIVSIPKVGGLHHEYTRVAI